MYKSRQNCLFERYRFVYYKHENRMFIFDKLTSFSIELNCKDKKILRINTIHQYKNIPLEHIGLEITNRCNLRCKHCWQGKKITNSDLNIDSINKVFKLCEKFGTLTVRISGGEPFLHNNIWEILDLAKRSHLSIILGTNGTLINKNTIKRLKCYPINLIDISLDGHNSKIHDNFRRKLGSFNKSLKAIKELINAGFRVNIKTVINRYNVDYIVNMAEFINNEIKDIFGWTLKDMIPYGNAKKNYNIIFPDPEHLWNSFKDLVNWIKINNPKFQIESYPLQLLININNATSANKEIKTPCGYKKNYLYIDSSGNIKCCALIKGVFKNIKNVDLNTSWKNLIQPPNNKNIKKCMSCIYFKKKICGFLSYVCPAVKCTNIRKDFLNKILIEHQ